MTTTSPDGIRSPNPGDPFNLSTDLAILANDVQDALIKRANTYVGTSAQRVAFTNAPEGTHWQDTNGDWGLFVRKGGTWSLISPDSDWINFSLSVSTSSARYRVIGDVVDIRVSITSSINANTVINAGTVPTPIHPSGVVPLRANGSGGVPATAYIDSSGVLRVRNTYSSSSSQTWISGVYFLG